MLSLLPPPLNPVWQGIPGQIIQGTGQSGEAGNEPLVVPHQTKKRFHLFFLVGAGPVPDGCDLALLGADVPSSDSVPQVRYLLQTQAALGGVGCESGLPQFPQDRPQLPEVDIPSGTVDDNVIYVGYCICLVRPKDLIHHPMECAGCAMNAEWENHILVQSARGCKRRLFPSGSAERHLPVPLGEVEVAGRTEPLN